MKANPQIGEVWFIDFGYEQKPRYALVIGSHSHSRLAVSSVLQITTQYGGTEFEVALPRVPWLREQSYVNVQTIQPVRWTEFGRKAPGQFQVSVMVEVRKALYHWLAM
jgi:mRNA interferase MazF